MEKKISDAVSWVALGLVVVMALVALYGALQANNQTQTYGVDSQSRASVIVVNKLKDDAVKGQVQTVVSLLEGVNKKVTSGSMKLDEAKKLAADLIRDISYNDDQSGYFWIDTGAGVNVVLYGNIEVEGKDRLAAKDTKGNLYIKDLIDIAKNGGGFYEYWFPKKGEVSSSLKRSYVAYFEPFDWVIGTGYYKN